MKKEKDFVLKRHQFWFKLAKPLARAYMRIKFGYKVKSHYKLSKKQPVIVLSNHQADLDPFFVEFAFNRYIYPVGSDHMFSTKGDTILHHFFPVIPKKKGEVDIRCTLMMKRVTKKGGSLLLFPEGNRSYAEFQFPIDDTIAKLTHYKIPIVLFNLHGGNGVDPRFAHKIRKGKFYGEIKRVIKPEEFDNYTDHELAELIRNELRVFDSDSGEKYKSKIRAEYLERVFFVCPKCGKVECLESKNEFIKCKNCGLEVEYTEDLKLKSSDPDFKFTRMVDWYDFQKEWVKNYQEKEDEVIFSDENVELTIRNPFHPVEFVTKGLIKLTNKALTINDKVFPLKEISVVSPLKGNRLLFTFNNISYHVQGHDRFNPLKYVFMINKLDSLVRERGVDKLFAVD